MQDFQLPTSIVSSYWNTLRIQSTQENVSWVSKQPFGPVIEFDRLRQFLAKEVEKAGSTCRLGCQYQTYQLFPDHVAVHLKDLHTSDPLDIKTQVLVDATGTDRHVIAPHYNKSKAMQVTGVEYHVQVNRAIYQRYAETLTFFLGHHWMPQGYGWIFPKSPLQLKVGVIRYFQNQQLVPYHHSYKYYLDQLLKLCGSYEMQDRHGKTIAYTLGQKDIYVHDRLIALGDAVSSMNPLGCEGLRHALASGHEAAKTIDAYLQKKVSSLAPYQVAMKRYYGRKWLYSEKLISGLFKSRHDRLIDHSIRSFSLMSNEEIIKVIFHYQFKYTVKSYFWYIMSRFKELFVK